MVSREGLEPSYPEGPVSETVAYAIPPPGHGTERGDRTHLVRLVEPVLSQRASSAWWGSRESNTGRAPYQRAQVNRTVLPLNSSAELLLLRMVRGQGIEPMRDLGVGQAPSPAGSPRVSLFVFISRGDRI